MNATMRRVVVGTVAASMAVTLAACGKAGDKKSSDNSSSSSSGSKTGSIGLLLPDSVTTRYEKFAKPYFEAKVKELCSGCDVQYANANANATTQAQQVSTMITKGVKVIVISAQDSAAIKSSIQQAVNKGIKVIAYDRLAQGPVSAYVSFDNVKVGQLQGLALQLADLDVVEGDGGGDRALGEAGGGDGLVVPCSRPAGGGAHRRRGPWLEVEHAVNPCAV